MLPDLMQDDVFQLETRRLWLRWPRAADVGAVKGLFDDGGLGRGDPSLAAPSASDFILAARTANFAGSALTLMLTPKARRGEAIGCLGLRPVGAGAADLDVWVGAAYRADGFIDEAARGLTELFTQLRLFDSIRRAADGGPRLLERFARRLAAGPDANGGGLTGGGAAGLSRRGPPARCEA